MVATIQRIFLLFMFIQWYFVFYRVVVRSRIQKEPRSATRANWAAFCVLNKRREGERRGKRRHKCIKKGPDHASVDCSTERNTRRPLRIQVLTQWGNIKGNSEAWNKGMQLAIQSTRLHHTKWDIFCWDVTECIFQEVQIVESAQYKESSGHWPWDIAVELLLRGFYGFGFWAGRGVC